MGPGTRMSRYRPDRARLAVAPGTFSGVPSRNPIEASALVDDRPIQLVAEQAGQLKTFAIKGFVRNRRTGVVQRCIQPVFQACPKRRRKLQLLPFNPSIWQPQRRPSVVRIQSSPCQSRHLPRRPLKSGECISQPSWNDPPTRISVSERLTISRDTLRPPSPLRARRSRRSDRPSLRPRGVRPGTVACPPRRSWSSVSRAQRPDTCCRQPWPCGLPPTDSWQKWSCR